MALIGAYSVLAKHPGRDIGGGATGLGMDRADAAKSSRVRARYASMAGWSPKSGSPDGVRPPYSWVIAPKPGGIASRGVITGTGSLAGSGAMGVNGTAAITGSGALSATGALVVSALAALSGSGAVTGASLAAVLQAIAALAGSGSATGTAGALGWVLAAIDGTGDLSATRYATGALAADITPFSELSPESLASAVWGAVAADANAAGSMGEKLNDSGSASNPWTEVIEAGFTAAEILRIVAASLAGALSGAGTPTLTIKGVDGTTDRVVATVDPETGDRLAITLDADA